MADTLEEQRRASGAGRGYAGGVRLGTEATMSAGERLAAASADARPPTTAGPLLAVPDGWETTLVDATTHVAHPVDPAQSAALYADVRPAAGDDLAERVLRDARHRLPRVQVVSLDPWPVAGTRVVGHRIALAHVEGGRTVCTLHWVATAGGQELQVTARCDSRDLPRHDPAFRYAVLGLRPPPAFVAATPTTGEHAEEAVLTGLAESEPWDRVCGPLEARRPQLVGDPGCRVLVEASVGTRSTRFDATVAGDLAHVRATPSPRSQHVRPEAGGDATFRIPTSQLALAIVQWLGLAPSGRTEARPVDLPLADVMARLLDPGADRPADVDDVLWHGPWLLWSLRSSATDAGLVVVDAGAGGQCALRETPDPDVTTLAPMPTYNVWLGLTWLVNESLAA